MAIVKSKTMENGAVGDYWRIINITIDRQNLKIIGQIALFKDSSTSAAGKPFLGEIKSFRFDLVVADLVSADNVISLMYDLIIADAETIVSIDLTGASITPRAKDPDIAGGVRT